MKVPEKKNHENRRRHLWRCRKMSPYTLRILGSAPNTMQTRSRQEREITNYCF